MCQLIIIRCTSEPYFYRDWRDSASDICFRLDYELHNVCEDMSKAGISTSEVIPYSIHYESETRHDLTKKFNQLSHYQIFKAP